MNKLGPVITSRRLGEVRLYHSVLARATIQLSGSVLIRILS